jgi:DNA-binding MarR family transcriptional regulator
MPTEVDNDLLVLVCDVARHTRTFADQMAQAHGLTRAQLIVIARLAGQPDLSQNELAALAEVTPMTIGRQIDALEELGLVERCPDPKDRRIWRLRLTPAAEPLMRDIKRVRSRLNAVLAKGIDADVLDTVIDALRQMKHNVTNKRVTKAVA